MSEARFRRKNRPDQIPVHMVMCIIKVMSLSLTPRHFVMKMEENVKRVDNRLNDYIKDSNENNIHDIRMMLGIIFLTRSPF